MPDFALNHLPLVGILISISLAFLLDALFGEAKRFHPLVGFGRLANLVEKKFNNTHFQQKKLKGALALILCVVPISLSTLIISQWLNTDVLAEVVFSAFVLYITLGWRSLVEHARAVSEPLAANQLDIAREAVSRIVSRDCESLNDTEIAVAATESVLENGADAIFSALFWFIVAGVPGVVCYRLCNTLDAMWGYKNTRFLEFGWTAARVDDVLNYIPARLSALSYCLCGHLRQGLNCWLNQAKHWKSPNAGPVMAAGAGALQVSLGGRAVYHGTTHLRPLLGLKLTKRSRPNSFTITRACRLINRSIVLWVLVLVLMTLFIEGDLLWTHFTIFQHPAL